MELRTGTWAFLFVAPSKLLVAWDDSRDYDLAAESAAALIRCGKADHAEVVRATAQSAQAAKNIALAQRHMGNTIHGK
ncbi:hypothetical protein [Pollutimonas harenae]|uniref:Uncharacterized protein n=1 Tax=Pollutimonas harenae TaxID=657015 RepID=A0A853GPD3_9BURK|nr:hypothetical protein [Pollutimonas harenae]NYT84027.1 hypothetical protein [Pollutimonas harenae]TEA73547.1 hypothetical protein ERD84_06505 [Pollutimonas harenae]